MLVTLAKDAAIAAATSYTWSYSPRSLQKVLIRMDDEQTAYEFKDATITVQVGSKTIVNSCQFWGLMGYSDLSSDAGQASNKGFAGIDLGHWEMLDNENVYVTIVGGAAAVTAADVSLLVDDIGTPNPLKLIQYSDTVFTAPGTVGAVAFASDIGDINAGTGSFTVTTNSYSSAFQTPSCVTWYNSEQVAYFGQAGYGILCKNKVPMDTSFNYTDNEVDRVLTIQRDSFSNSAVNKSIKQNRLAIANAVSLRAL